MATEPRTLNPVQFYSDKPFSVMGDPVKKDFSSEVSKVDQDVADDPDSDDSDVETSPQEDSSVEAAAQKRTGKEIEDVDAPVLEGSESTDVADGPDDDDEVADGPDDSSDDSSDDTVSLA